MHCYWCIKAKLVWPDQATYQSLHCNAAAGVKAPTLTSLTFGLYLAAGL